MRARFHLTSDNCSSENSSYDNSLFHKKRLPDIQEEENEEEPEWVNPFFYAFSFPFFYHAFMLLCVIWMGVWVNESVRPVTVHLLFSFSMLALAVFVQPHDLTWELKLCLSLLTHCTGCRDCRRTVRRSKISKTCPCQSTLSRKHVGLLYIYSTSHMLKQTLGFLLWTFLLPS